MQSLPPMRLLPSSDEATRKESPLEKETMQFPPEGITAEEDSIIPRIVYPPLVVPNCLYRKPNRFVKAYALI